MLVVIDNHAQMCNRMWALAPFIALAKEHKKKILILNFQEYKNYYQFAESDHIVDFNFSRNRIINGLFKKLMKKAVDTNSANKFRPLFNLLGVKNVNKSTDISQIHQFIKNNRIVVIESWKAVKDNPTLLKHDDFVKRLFTPAIQYKKPVDNTFNRLRQNNKTIIGVHIRRGDYKTWKDGKYYYDDRTYADIVKHLQGLLPGKDVLFYICSNEEISPAAYNAISYYTSPKSHPVEDLYALSKCDYIIGPPSTFSMWASFYGNVPICFIHHAETDIDLKEFSPIIYQNQKKDGTPLW